MTDETRERAACGVTGCDRPVKANNLCGTHYARWVRTGDPGSAPIRPSGGATCRVEGCDRPHNARGLCGTHYARWQRTGTTDAPVRRPASMACRVEGCTKPHKTRGLCRTHYSRWLRTGSPGPAAIRSHQPHGDHQSGNGDPDDGCSIEGCTRKHAARGYCKAHLTRWYQYGDPRAKQPIGPPPVRNPDTYWAVHERIRRERGPATALTCVNCGAAARDWSYDYSDPDERVYQPRGYRYSTNPARYVPRCRSCHRRATRRGRLPLDAAHVAGLYRDGHTIAGIAQLTGHSRAEIHRTLTDHGVTIKQAHKRQRQTHP